MIFISHATPEDNDFVRWLGTRLTGHGYKVWADLFELKGGTPFWSSIEEALRHHAIKVIFVVSEKSVDPNRSGVRNELSVADAVKKNLRDQAFIIPVRIDDTPFGSFPIQIHQLNAIDFSKGWGQKLPELLDSLEAGNAPKFAGDQTADFEKWRASMVRTASSVEIAAEPVLTNLLAVSKMPASINCFEYGGDNTKIDSALRATGIPCRTHHRLIFSFAQMATIQETLSPSFSLKARATVPLDDFLAGTVQEVTSPPRDAVNNIATHLLREHIERYLVARGLKRFELSSGSAFYFPTGLVPNDKVPYLAASGRRTNKNVVGRSARNKVNWHLAMKVNIALKSPAVVRFKPYICFSEDGKTAITDLKRSSAIRRRFCKNWWNPHWRQLQQAFCAFLSADQQLISIDLDGPETLVLSGRLLELIAARKMPDDLQLAEEPDDPAEPPDDDTEEYDDLDEIAVEEVE
jgi:hypothetical protein